MSHELTTYKCTATQCTAYVERRVSNEGIYLCHEHMILTWAIVQDWVTLEGTVPTLTRREPITKPGYEGWVYYLKVGDRLKIGHSIDPDRRLAHYPPDSELLAIRRGNRKLERAEHIRYDNLLTDGREWFCYSDWIHDDILLDHGRPPIEMEGFIPDVFDDEGTLPTWQRRKPKANRNPVTIVRPKR